MTHRSYEGWAIVELTDGRERGGRVVLDGDPLIRIDVPVAGAGGAETTVTEFWGRPAILSLRPCTEEIARHLLRSSGDERPVRPVDRRSARPTLPDYWTARRFMEQGL